MKKYIGKIDLFESSLGGEKALIQCSFDSDLKTNKKKTNKQTNKQKKDPPAHTYSKKVVEANQTIIFFGLSMIKAGLI